MCVFEHIQYLCIYKYIYNDYAVKKPGNRKNLKIKK